MKYFVSELIVNLVFLIQGIFSESQNNFIKG
jgi:hypothetical protein